jgi:hypothetical protein
MITDWLQGIGSIGQAVAVAFAAWAAFHGVSAWRAQLLGKRKAEIAETALVDAYRIKEAFDFIRHPISFSNEGATREKEEGESEDLSKRLNAHFVPIERINKSMDAFADLNKSRLLVGAYFGRDAEIPFAGLFEVRQKIANAASSLLMATRERALGETVDPSLIKEWRSSFGLWDPVTISSRRSLNRLSLT